MDIIIPTKEQIEAMKRPNRIDWSELYAKMEEHGALIVPDDGSQRMAYQHFKALGRRVRWKDNRDGTYSIWFDGKVSPNKRREKELDLESQ